MIKPIKHRNFKLQMLAIACGFAQVIDGIVTVITFGLFMSTFAGKVAAFRLDMIKRDRARNML